MPELRPSHAAVLAPLRALIAGLTASARAVERRTGVTNAQLFLLQTLATTGPSTLGALAERVGTQPSTVSLVIGRLQRAGLVTRVRAVEDRRQVVITLTAAGQRLLRRAPEAPTTRLLEAISQLPARDALKVGVALEMIVQRLGIAYAEPPLLFEPASGHRGRTT
jgi:DNA-binding MarR family transcriptional regulator